MIERDGLKWRTRVIFFSGEHFFKPEFYLYNYHSLNETVA